MLAAAALLASCSQNDALQNTVDNNEGLKPMTLTVYLPDGGMQTRAEGDAAATCRYSKPVARNWATVIPT